jgi:hypothetical protein
VYRAVRRGRDARRVRRLGRGRDEVTASTPTLKRESSKSRTSGPERRDERVPRNETRHDEQRECQGFIMNDKGSSNYSQRYTDDCGSYRL